MNSKGAILSISPLENYCSYFPLVFFSRIKQTPEAVISDVVSFFQFLENGNSENGEAPNTSISSGKLRELGDESSKLG